MFLIKIKSIVNQIQIAMSKIYLITILFFIYGFQNTTTAQIDYDSAARALSHNIGKYFYRQEVNYYREFPDTANNHKVDYLWYMDSLLHANNDLENTSPTPIFLLTKFSPKNIF
jgi:hypothetical protein